MILYLIHTHSELTQDHMLLTLFLLITKIKYKLITIIQFFFDHIKYQNTDLKNVIETMQGYLKLHLSKFNNTHKKLDKIWINSNEYYIMSGSYITPFSSSLIKNEQ